MANTIAKVRIILIPGLWLDASSWDGVVAGLEAAGHTAVPLTLPGMQSRDADRSRVTLRDQVDAVIAAVDAAVASDGSVVLVGHSGGGTIAHAVADARPTSVSRVVYVDAVPTGSGRCINDELPVVDGEIPLPDWSVFDDESLVGLDDDLRAQFRARAIPAPVRVAQDSQELSDERRYDVPVTVISCEVPSAVLRDLIDKGHPYTAELGLVHDVKYIDLPTGHWPQFSRPDDLTAAILAAVQA